MAEVLSVAINELIARESAITRLVQIREHLLELHSIIHVQEVLDEVAKSGLLDLVFGRE